MEVIYGLLPGMLLLGIVGVGVFFWAVRNGQYDDMDGAANRVLMDDEDQDRKQDQISEQYTDNAEQSSTEK